MKTKRGDEREREKKVRRRTANISSNEDRTELAQASTVKIAEVAQKIIEIQRLIPVDAVRMVKHPTDRRRNERKKQQANKP
jgi:hypothetical protein